MAQGFGRKDLVYLTIIASLIGLSVYQYNNIRTITVEKEKVVTQIQEKTLEVDDLKEQMDQMTRELNQKIAEIEQLGGDVEALKQAKAQLEKEKKAIAQKNNQTQEQLQQLQNKLSGYEVMLREKDKEIAKLREMNKELFDQTVSLKTEKNELSEKISNLDYEKKELNQKMQGAAVLKAKSLKVVALNKKDKEYQDGEFRAKNIEKLRIEYALMENSLVEIGEKPIYLRLIDPDGATIYDLSAGSGRFNFNNNELFYSTKQNILYDRSEKKEQILYIKGDDYKKGKHVVELYSNNQKIGFTTFIVK